MDDSESPELMDVLIDTLLPLLPQSSAPLRSAVEQVFRRYFCESVTDDGLLQMLRVIKKDLKPARHKGADSKDDDGNDDDLLGTEDAEESDEANMAETGEIDGLDEQIAPTPQGRSEKWGRRSGTELKFRAREVILEIRIT